MHTSVVLRSVLLGKKQTLYVLLLVQIREPLLLKVKNAGFFNLFVR